MKSILEELWYGNICPNTESRKVTQEKKLLIDYIKSHHNQLQATLTDTQKEILEKYNDCYDEMMELNERQIFVYAFCLGARIAFESLQLNGE